MTLSPQMKLKMEKIDSLIDKGYGLKTQLGTLIPNLISPQGKLINTFSRRYGDDPLASFSWIAFFFPFALATQIRHWSYFWFVGIIAFVLDVFVAIPFNIDINTGYIHIFIITNDSSRYNQYEYSYTSSNSKYSRRVLRIMCNKLKILDTNSHKKSLITAAAEAFRRSMSSRR